jgi:signal transduction histidine kinase
VHPDAGAVIMTGYADTDTAVGALNDGAFAYLLKPCAMTDVKAVLARAVERFKLLEENRDLLKALRGANAVLEEKVAARTDELRHTNLQLMETIEKLREADETKSQFVSMVSHELGTPLTIIIGFADTFLRQGPTSSEEQKRHYVEIIREGAQRLARLIESMLNLAHIRDKRIRLEYVKFDLQVVMNGVVE